MAARRGRGRFNSQYFEAARLPAITEIFREYDSALCRAATEGQDKYVLKEKVNNAARIACKSFEGKYAWGMARRLNEISEDEMAIQENLLFVLDSIMRHATKDGKKTMKRFEQAFSPMLVSLFKRALRRLESREVVADYLRTKLLPTWRQNLWFTKELPRVMKVLDSKPKAERIEVKRAPYSPIRDEGLGEDTAFDFTEYDEEGPEAPEGAPWEPAYDAFAARSPYTEPSPYIEGVKEDKEKPDVVQTETLGTHMATVVASSSDIAVEPSALAIASPTTPVPSSPSSPTFSPARDTKEEIAQTATEVLPSRVAEPTIRELTVPAPSSQERLAAGSVPSRERELTVPVPSSQSSRPSALRQGQVPSVPGSREEIPPFLPQRRVTTQAEMDELTMPVPTEAGASSDEEMEVEPVLPIVGDRYAGDREQRPSDLPQDMTPFPAGLMTPSALVAPVIAEMPSIPPPVPETRPPTTMEPPSVASDVAPTQVAPTVPLQTEPPPPSTESLSSQPMPTQVLPTPESVAPSGEERVPTVSIPSRQSTRPSEPSSRPSEPPTVVPAPTEAALSSRSRIYVPSTPTEVPVPTEEPAPTSPAPSSPPQEASVSAIAPLGRTTFATSFATGQTISLRSKTPTQDASTQPSSPPEMPVPTEVGESEPPTPEEMMGSAPIGAPATPPRLMPSAVSETASVATTHSTVPVPQPTVPGTRVSALPTRIVETTQVPLMPSRVVADVVDVRTGPSSPTEVPVPTEAGVSDEEGMFEEELMPAAHAPAPQAVHRSTEVPPSPTEMPVPTEQPSPTSMADMDDDTALAQVQAPLLLPTRAAQGTTGQRPPAPSSPTVPQLRHRTTPAPSSPTDAPIVPPRAPVSPTAVPTETGGVTTRMSALRVPRATRTDPRTRPTVAPSSPTEMPVPTEMPSPTSPAPAEEDDDVSMALRLLPSRLAPASVASSREADESHVPVPSHPTSRVATEVYTRDDVPVPTESRRPTTQAPTSPPTTQIPATRTVPPVTQTGDRRSRPTIPSSPTEIPAPTELPSPTSPAPMDTDLDLIQQPPLPPARQPPSIEQGQVVEIDEDVVPFAVPLGASQQMGHIVSSPTEASIDIEPPVLGQRTGVPTDVPSEMSQFGLRPPASTQPRAETGTRAPTSPSEMPVPTEVGLSVHSPTEAPPPSTMELGPPPVPTRRLGSVPTDVPSERSHLALQPPGDRRVDTGTRAPTSPSEMPVPTEVGPSVHSPTEAPIEVPTRRRGLVPTDVPSERSHIALQPPGPQLADTGTRAPTSPAEMPVPTEAGQSPVDSPTEVPVGPELLVPAERPGQRSRPQPSSPTEMAMRPPVAPTEVPTERRVRPLPTSPTHRGAPTEMPVPTEPGQSVVGTVRSRPRQPSSPTEMPVPTELPSPTSPAPLDHDYDVIQQPPLPLASLPAQSGAARTDAMDEDLIDVPAPAALPPRDSRTPVADVEAEMPVPTRMLPPRDARTPQADVESEMPVPARAVAGPRGSVRSRPQPTSPSEMPVPTEMPSPTSPAPEDMHEYTIEAVPPSHASVPRVPEVPSDVEVQPTVGSSEMTAPPPTVSQSVDHPTLEPPTFTREPPVPTQTMAMEPDTPAMGMRGQDELFPPPSMPARVPARVADDADDSIPVPTEVMRQPSTQAPSSPSATQRPTQSVVPQAQQRVRSRPTAPSSPTEMPVPTEMPSPTSPAPMEAELDLIQQGPAPPVRQPTSMARAEADDEDVVPGLPARSSSAIEGQQEPSSPAMEPPVFDRRPGVRSRPQPSSPTELGDLRPLAQEDVPVQARRTPSRQAPSSPSGTQIPTQVPATATASVPQVQKTKERSRPTQPTSPSEMPVPTEMPSPTSPAAEDTDHESVQEAPLVPARQPTEAEVADADEVDLVPPAMPVGGLQQEAESSPTELPEVRPMVPPLQQPGQSAPSSPTELPAVRPVVPPPQTLVPTEVPSERRVPTDTQTRLRPIAPGHRSRPQAPSSPSEMPVPTELPSPTSLAASIDEDYDITQQPPMPPAALQATILETVAERIPELEEIAVPASMPQLDARTPVGVETDMPTIAVPSRPQRRADIPPTDEPSEMPVPSATRRRMLAPTDEPSEMPVPSRRRIGGVSTHRTERSPTEMPVPTQMPSPTSPAAEEDEEMQALAGSQPAGLSGVGLPTGMTAAQPPSSPTELPQLYDPTSPAGDEEEAMEEPPLVAPTRTFETSVPTTEPPPTNVTTEPPLEVPTTLPAPEVPATVETVEPPSTEPPPTVTESTVPPTMEPPTLEPPTREADTALPSASGSTAPPAASEPDTPAVPQVLMMRFPDAPFPPPAKFKTELIRSLRALGATRLSDLALRLREGLLAEVRGPPLALAALRALPLQNLRVIRYKISEIQGPGTEASLKWFKTKVRAPLAPTAQDPSASQTMQSPAEHSSLPTLLGPPGTPSEVTRLHTPTQASPAEPFSASGVTRVHSHSVGFTRPSPAEMTRAHSPTEVFSIPAGGTPTQRIARGFKAPLTPQGQIVSSTGEMAPGTPTYSPTEFFADPATPQDAAIARALRRPIAQGPSVEPEASSPTYLEDGRELPLPPTPTYSAGSSPTFVEENEPPTPTLEADDDEFADDTSVADWVASATPKLIPATGTPQSGPSTPASRAVGTPSTVQPTTPLAQYSLSTRPAGAMRLPGMESPTPTYEPDDETVYGDDASSVASWVASGTPRGFDGTSSLPGTPLSIGPSTPLGRSGTPQGGPFFATQPPTPVGYVQSLGQVGPGTPISAAGSTPLAVGVVPSAATPPGSQPGTPQSFQPGTPQGRQPGTPQQVLPAPQSQESFVAPGSAAASSSEAPAPGRLASEVFPQLAGKRKQEGQGDEELPPWKRRAQRRKKQ